MIINNRSENNLNKLTLEEISQKYDISIKTLNELILNHPSLLFSFDNDGKYYEYKVLENISLISLLKQKPEYLKVFNTNDSIYVSDEALKINEKLLEYLYYHNFFTEFCWLIKLYFSEKATIKSKKYKLDILFQTYLLKNIKHFQKIKKVDSLNDTNKVKITTQLKKGWYNELIPIPLTTN